MAVGERTTAHESPRQAGDPAPPRPHTPEPGICGNPYPHEAHDWQTSAAAGSFWFHCEGRPVPRALARPHTETYHVSGRHFDHELGCTVVRGIGFSWRCTCGERGRIVADRREALAGKREHEAEHR